MPGAPVTPVAATITAWLARELNKEMTMGKYLFEAKYSVEGTKGLVRDGGSGRRAAVEKAATGAGGRVESFYYAFGGSDVYVVMDLPDNTTAAAMALAVNQAGGASVKTI